MTERVTTREMRRQREIGISWERSGGDDQVYRPGSAASVGRPHPIDCRAPPLSTPRGASPADCLRQGVGQNEVQVPSGHESEVDVVTRSLAPRFRLASRIEGWQGAERHPRRDAPSAESSYRLMESDRRVFAWGLVRARIRDVQDCAKASASASSRHFAVARVPSRQRARSWRPSGALNSSPDVEGFRLPEATNLSRIVPGGAMDRRHVSILRLAAAIAFIAGIGGAAYIFPTHAMKVACALRR